MFNHFKETYKSLQDDSFGNLIITKSVKSVIIYWLKYLLLVLGIFALFGIFYLTNALPQAPKYIKDNFPKGDVQLKEGILSSTIVQPYIYQDTDFIFIFDTSATSSALDIHHSGILVSKDRVIIKSEDGSLQERTYTGVPSFSTSADAISTFVSQNFAKIWFIMFVVIFVFSFFIGLLMFIQKFFSYAIWSAIFLLISKFVLHKNLSILEIFKIVIYASILPFLLSVIFSSAQNPLFEALNMGILAYFAFNWIRNISASSSSKPALETPKTSSKKNISKKSKKSA